MKNPIAWWYAKASSEFVARIENGRGGRPHGKLMTLFLNYILDHGLGKRLYWTTLEVRSKIGREKNPGKLKKDMFDFFDEIGYFVGLGTSSSKVLYPATEVEETNESAGALRRKLSQSLLYWSDKWDYASYLKVIEYYKAWYLKYRVERSRWNRYV